MKYEVIGWANCDGMYPEHQDITACVDKVIIDEIRKHGYLFGGDSHETYSPVLNDGTVVNYSWRGWGRIMAIAHGRWTGGVSYMFGYMDKLLNPECIKYPQLSVDDRRIVPKESLAETIVMRLEEDEFAAIKSGEKTVEVRLFDNESKQVDIGDYIEFFKSSDETQRVKRKVVDLDVWQSFEKVFTNAHYESGERVVGLRFTPRQLGVSQDATVDSLVEKMYKYYSKEQEEEYGVIAFVIEEPKHSCSTYLSVCINEGSKDDFYYIRNILYCFVPDFDCFDQCFRIGQNDNYDVDINVMLRETLKDFLGKEDVLKDFQSVENATISLDIFATIIKDSEEPNQYLSLDDDMIEFLSKADVKLNLKYKII